MLIIDVLVWPAKVATVFANKNPKQYLGVWHLWTIGAFRDSCYEVIIAHAQITGCQYSGQHNGHIYGMQVKLVEIMFFCSQIHRGRCLNIILVNGVFQCTTFTENCNLNLNNLLVKRQIDNPSPGAVTGGKLVPMIPSQLTGWTHAPGT